MSALQLPSPAPSTRPGRRHLRVVEAPASSLAPSGPLQAWRRRLGALVVLAAIVVLVGQALLGPADAVAPATQPVSTATVVVQPGDTLWDIASTHAPADTSTWTYVEQLTELNGVSNGTLQAWQVLRLPSA